MRLVEQEGEVISEEVEADNPRDLGSFCDRYRVIDDLKKNAVSTEPVAGILLTWGVKHEDRQRLCSRNEV